MNESNSSTSRSGQVVSWFPDDDPAGEMTLEENWLFRLRRERFCSRATGKKHDFYVIHLADAVNVIAITRDRRILMVRQFRAGNRLDSLETPGGLLDPGEDPCVAAARELEEETGYRGGQARLLGQVWANPSILTSRNYFVLVEDATRVSDTRWDENEELVVEEIAVDRVGELVRQGEVGHALSVCALLWWLGLNTGGVLSR